MSSSEFKLRGHHLLCILSYCGEGYTPDFIKNFDAIVDQINNGASLLLVSGVDSICAALHRDGSDTCDHAEVCRTHSVKSLDSIALKQVSHALKIPTLKAGDRLNLGRDEVTSLRVHFANGEIRRACKSCPWRDFCSQIATKKFSGVKLLP